MTKNNLKEHLNWLLSSDIFAAPTLGPTRPDTVVSPPTSLAREESTHHKPSNAVGVPVIRQLIRDNALLQSTGSRSLGKSLIASDIGSMARLQAGSTTRSKLLSRDMPSQLQTPTPYYDRVTSTSLRDQYNAPYENAAFQDHERRLNLRVVYQNKELTYRQPRRGPRTKRRNYRHQHRRRSVIAIRDWQETYLTQQKRMFIHHLRVLSRSSASQEHSGGRIAQHEKSHYPEEAIRERVAK